jgi:ornithine decarboxylase
MNLNHLNTAYEEWTRVFPTIRPFYAVKCNPDSKIVKRLSELGTGFDCASPAEIDLAIEAGVDPNDIIYANPVKRATDIRYAWSRGVTMTTVDSDYEIAKIDQCAPHMKVILRIKASDPTAQCVLSNKYGVEFSDAKRLLALAKCLNIRVIGISFHVGSGCRDQSSYKVAMQEARQLYTDDMYILDIGGGFTYGNLPGDIIHEALIAFADTNVTVIAEPGRYFAEQVGTLVSPIIGKKVLPDETQYYISDSLYGSFNCILYDHAKPVVETYKTYKSDLRKSRVFGSTCDGMDEILPEVYLPDMEVNDWMIFEKMGAYTTAASTNFNGIPFTTRTRYYLE